MSSTIIREWYLLWYAVAAGFAYAWVYDNLRLFRRLIKHGRILVDIEDLLYWVWCFVTSFVLLYYVNQGVIRAFAVVGAGAGMYLYYLTIGRFYVRVLYFLISKLCSPIICFWRFIKNGLTRIINHFKIKLTVFYTKRKEKGEREHAESLRKKQNRKKTCVPTKEK